MALLTIPVVVLALCVSSQDGAPPTAGGPGSVPSAPGDSPSGPTQRGMTLLTWISTGYDGPGLAGAVREIEDTGARWIQIVPTWYQATASANEFGRTPDTVTDEGIRRTVALARARGLEVLLKPHVDLSNEVSRTAIRPADPDRWFASYRGFITHYARLAGELGVEQLAVGTELAGVSGDRDRWLAVVQAVRAVYAGPLVYAAAHDEYAGVAFWDALDLIGVDAYWPLAERPTSDPAALRRAWRPIQDELAAFATKAGRRILFTEAGYTSQRGTTTAPASWQISRQRDEAEQAAAYEALLATFSHQPWWAGVFWWVPAESTEFRHLGFTVHGKAAESVLHRWWNPPGR